MGRRVLAFFLGMIFGMIFLIGGLGLGIYIAVTTLTPNDITDDAASDYIGDFADMTIMQMVNSVKTLYSEKAGVAQDGKYYSLGEFLDNYNINTETAFGVKLPESVLNVPVFEYFQENGVDNALQQISVAAIPDIVNLFATNADGSGYINSDAIEKLNQYNLKELLDESKGIAYVFQDVLLSDIMPESFPAQDSDNKMMWAIGQGSIGKLYAALGGSNNLLLQVKSDGGLAELGKMPIAQLLGSNDDVIATLLGDTTFADLVDDNGSLCVDEFISSVYVGSLISCIRHEISDISDYEEILLSDKKTIWKATIGGKEVFADADNGKYYEKALYCTENHEHTGDCYDFVWYNSVGLSDGHANCKDDEMIDTDGHHARISGIYKAFVNLKLADMMNGSSEMISEELQNITLSEMMNGNVSGVAASFADMTIGELLNGGIDDTYLGCFFKYDRITTDKPDSAQKINNFYVGVIDGEISMSDDGTTWYKAKVVCENEESSHVHTRDCYSYIWMNGKKEATGLMGKLSESKIGELGDLNDKILTFTLEDVMGDNLSGLLLELKDTPLNKLSDEINNVYLGAAIKFHRKNVDVANYPTAIFENVHSDGTTFAKSDDGKKWYEAELTCDAEHDHNDDCYEYVWYKNSACTNKVTGIQKCFVNSTLDNVSETMDTLTLKKLGVQGNTILNALGDTPLNQLSKEMNKMKLGTMFGFTEQTEGGVTVWYEPCKANCGHASDEHVTLDGKTGYFTPAKGINAKMSVLTMSELTSGDGMTAIVKDFTIGEMEESGIVKLTAQDKYKLDIIFDASGKCSLQDYLVKKSTQPSLTAKDYYESKHDDDSYRGAWGELTVTDFISQMLKTI